MNIETKTVYSRDGTFLRKEGLSTRYTSEVLHSPDISVLLKNQKHPLDLLNPLWMTSSGAHNFRGAYVSSHGF